MENIELGERIKELRIARKLSQVALAKSLDLNPQTIRDYETGRRSPTIKGLPSLAKALDVSISDLIEGSSSPPPIKTLPVSQLLAKLSNVPDWVYEDAQEFGSDHKVWDQVRVTFKDALKDIALAAKKTHQA